MPLPDHHRARRRCAVSAALLALTVGVVSGAGVASAAPGSEPTAARTDFTSRFAVPATADRPLMRWWMPLAPITEAEVRRELADIADSGFGGVEIGAFPVGADEAQYGWNSESWNTAMTTVLDVADELGLRVDFMVSANYPTAAPATAVTPDEVGSEKELAWGAVQVAAGTTFRAAAPAPIKAAAPGVSKQDLQAVVVGRMLPGEVFDPARVGTSQTTTVRLDPATLRVLPVAADGTVSFDAPAGGPAWVLTSYWLRGTGTVVADVTDPTSYVVDHLSEVGTRAWTRLWEENLLADPRAAALIRENGGALFEDSLHLYTYQLWTDDLFEEFERRRGYDVTPFLPALLQPNLNNYFARGNYDANSSPATFELGGTDSDLAQRVRNDYFETLTDLYVERHIIPMREWAHAQGFEIRFQPSYGQSLEQSQAAMEIDVPETEAFQHGSAIDAYRYLAAAAHAADKPVISTECCATRGQGNAFGWEQTLRDVEKSYAGGVNQVVFHGYSYNESPDATWPGWLRFGQNSFSENYGRQPTWELVEPVADYLARQQTALQEGRQQTDVAVYRHSYWDQLRTNPAAFPGSQYYLDSGQLAGAGFSYGFVSPAMLDRKEFRARDGQLDAEGAAYDALVFDEETAVPFETAQKLRNLARNGLPMVFVGSVPSRSPFAGERDDDRRIARIMAQLRSLPNVRVVGSKDDVPLTLARLGVQASAEPSSKTDVLSVRRTTDDGELYYLYNPGTTTETRTFSFVGEGLPYELDAWTGQITPIAEHRRTGDRVTVEVTLEPEETTVIGVSPQWQPDGSSAHARGTSVVDVTGGDAVYTATGIAVRANEAGRVTARLDDGRRLAARVPAVPAVSVSADWSLTVEGWEQAAGDDPYTIAKRVLSRDLVAQDGVLPSWRAIPGLEDVSGIGTYRGKITVAEGWDGSSGATLDLGRVSDTVTLRINNQEVAVDRGNPVVDVSRYLHTGGNRITVTVGTTLRNRMRVVNGPKATPSTSEPQDYGLFGPVRISAYREVPLTLPSA